MITRTPLKTCELTTASTAYALFTHPEQKYLSLGCPVLDSFLGGGLPCNCVTELAGESGVGKTQICLQALLQGTLSPHGLKKACYISTEGPFPMRRLKQLLPYFCEKYNLRQCEVMDNLYISTIEHIDDLVETLRAHVLALLSQQRVGIVILDSIAALCRSEFDSTPMALSARGYIFGEVAALMKMYSGQYRVPFLIVNQVTGSFQDDSDAGGNPVPALGLGWANLMNIRLMVSKRMPQKSNTWTEDDLNSVALLCDSLEKERATKQNSLSAPPCSSDDGEYSSSRCSNGKGLKRPFSSVFDCDAQVGRDLHKGSGASVMSGCDLIHIREPWMVQLCSCSLNETQGLAKTACDPQRQRGASKLGTINVTIVKTTSGKSLRIVTVFAQCLPGRPDDGEPKVQRLQWLRKCLASLSVVMRTAFEKEGVPMALAVPNNCGCDLDYGQWVDYEREFQSWSTQHSVDISFFDLADAAKYIGEHHHKLDSAPAVTGATSGAVRDMHFSDSDGARLLHQSPAVTASSLTICRSSSQRLSAATTTGTKSSTGAVSKVCLQKFEKNYTVEKSNMLVAPLREMSIIFAPHLAYGKCMFSVEADKVAGREWV